MSYFVEIPDFIFSEMEEDVLYPVEIEGERIVLVRKGDKVYAFEDECSHMEYPLHDGALHGYTVHCAYHGAEFDIRTGDVLCLPAFAPIEVFPVRVQDDKLFIDLDPDYTGEGGEA